MFATGVCLYLKMLLFVRLTLQRALVYFYSDVCVTPEINQILQVERIFSLNQCTCKHGQFNACGPYPALCFCED